MFRTIGKLVVASAITWGVQAFLRVLSERAEKRKALRNEDRAQLQAWEGEGGNPSPRRR